MEKNGKKRFFLYVAVMVSFTLFSFLLIEEWKAPPEADKLVNTLKDDAGATKAGKKIYNQMCAVCHGNTGKGDGLAAASLNPRPSNFANEKFQDQSDGAIFWKITEGNPPMASYKETYTETQRWQLVNYLRTLKK